MNEIQNKMLEKIEEDRDILKINFKTMNVEQEEKIKERFNHYVSFSYIEKFPGVLEDGEYIFLMEVDDFKSFKYYLGMEYETPEMLTKTDELVLVSYDYSCERAKDLFKFLQEYEDEAY